MFYWHCLSRSSGEALPALLCICLDPLASKALQKSVISGMENSVDIGKTPLAEELTSHVSDTQGSDQFLSAVPPLYLCLSWWALLFLCVTGYDRASTWSLSVPWALSTVSLSVPWNHELAIHCLFCLCSKCCRLWALLVVYMYAKPNISTQCCLQCSGRVQPHIIEPQSDLAVLAQTA